MNVGNSKKEQANIKNKIEKDESVGEREIEREKKKTESKFRGHGATISFLQILNEDTPGSTYKYVSLALFAQNLWAQWILIDPSMQYNMF